MWANLAKRAASVKNFKLSSESFCLPSSSYQRFYRGSNLLEGINPSETRKWVNSRCPVMGFCQVGELGIPNFRPSEKGFGSYFFMRQSRGYASAAEAIESEDTEEDFSRSDEIQQLMEEMMKQEKAQQPQVEKPMHQGERLSNYKYKMLRKRQIKVETEAWDQAAKEYQELLADMCEQKLAPNLPYMKSLFLGWFEPLRNAIAEDQVACRDSSRVKSHAPYIYQLPADMMAVITMHKLMGLLMSNSNGIGSARVIQAALQIGEAIEHEVY